VAVCSNRHEAGGLDRGVSLAPPEPETLAPRPCVVVEAEPAPAPCTPERLTPSEPLAPVVVDGADEAAEPVARAPELLALSAPLVVPETAPVPALRAPLALAVAEDATLDPADPAARASEPVVLIAPLAAP